MTTYIFDTFFTANVLQIQNKIFLPFYKSFSLNEKINLKDNFRRFGMWVKTEMPNARLTDIEIKNQCYNKYYMGILKAFEVTKNKANQLKEIGVEVKFIPYSKKNHDKEYLEKLKKEYPEIPMDYWGTIVFKAENIIHLEKINDANNYLSMIGIGFDRGGCGKKVEWQLDWSFNYNGGHERAEDIQATNDLMEGLKDYGCEDDES